MGRSRAGVLASLCAEAAFIASVALLSAVRGMDPWRVTRLPAAFLLGPEAVKPAGFVVGDVVLGVTMHLGLAIPIGVLYAALLPRVGVSPLAGGLITGAVLYVLRFWILPLSFPAWLAPFWLPAAGRALQAAAHVLYGTVFGLVYQRLV